MWVSPRVGPNLVTIRSELLELFHAHVIVFTESTGDDVPSGFDAGAVENRSGDPIC